MASALAQVFDQSDQSDKAARLRGGNMFDLLPMIARIELEHRAWAAEDPENRCFGPPSFFVASENALQVSLLMVVPASMRTTFERHMKSGQLSPDDFAKLVAETLARKGT